MMHLSVVELHLPSGDLHPMALAIERRVAVRYPAADGRTYVQLIEWTGRRMIRARLVNISAGGALIRSDAQPCLLGQLRMQMEDSPEAGWFAARVVHFDPSRLIVGIRFDRPCPREVLLKYVRRVDSRQATARDEETPDLRDLSTACWPPPEKN
jgi:hypothetical protein